MGDRITCQPRRFKIGDKYAIKVKEQIAIANMLIGDIAGDQETRGLQGWVYKVGFTFTSCCFFTKAAESTAKSVKYTTINLGRASKSLLFLWF